MPSVLRLCLLCLAATIPLSALAGGFYGEKGDREGFVKAYRTKDADKRAEAVRSLEGSDEKSTIALIVRALLSDKSPDVRLAAAETLANCEDLSGISIKPLLKSLNNKKETVEVRIAVAKSLETAPYKGAPVDALIKMIGSITPEQKELHEFGAVCTEVLTAITEQDFGKGDETAKQWADWWKAASKDYKKLDKKQQHENLKKLRELKKTQLN